MLKQIQFSEKKIFLFLLAISGVMILFISLIGDKGYFELKKLKQKELELQKEIKTLSLQKKSWEEKLHYMQNSNQYIETIAREKFGFVKENEIVFEIIY